MLAVDNLIFALTLFAALGCGLMAGLFFAFSVCVMKALARLFPTEGIAAMQSINIAILNPVFFAVFFGTAAACFLAIVASLFRWQDPGAGYLLAGGALYLVGSLLVTIAFNIPENEALATVTPDAPGAASLWANYLVTWTAWNHIRTVAALAAAALFTIALCY